MTRIDLEPAARGLIGIVRAVGDADLVRPTPCPDYTVGDLLDHVAGLSVAFAAAARKQPLAGGPSGDASCLDPNWRARIPRDVAALVEAWRDPAAWSGTTHVGGVDLPGAIAGVVALDEVVVHGWDLAVATGQPYDVDDASIGALHAFLEASVDTDQPPPADSPFGPPIAVGPDAPLLDRVLGLTGRDPAWRPPERAPD